MKSYYALVLSFFFSLCATAQINIVTEPAVNNITTSGFTVTWTTDDTGSTSLKYGLTPSFELGVLTGAGGTTNHVVTLSGASASQVYYVQGYSTSGIYTAYSDTKIFMTASNSSGIIKCYFVKTVDTSASNPSGNYAKQLLNTVDDTLAAYINRAQYTLDIAIYNLDSSAIARTIINAINSAYGRGVRVRLIYESSNSNTGLPFLNSGIVTFGDLNFGLMHNKFAVIDVNSANANQPVVWTGSTNWTTDQLSIDANNVIVIQDQSLAIAYTMEFEEMWGGSSATPNTSLALFGSAKSDNTPHEFMIGGHRVEMYFSPSDSTTSHIMQTASSADANLFFALLTITRTDIATSVANRVAAGVFGAGLENDTASSYQIAPFQIIQAEMGSYARTYPTALPGILHHKYLIVDVDHPTSDPLVLTGSPNWSSNSTSNNDENMVIVHDQLIANQYFQEFIARFTESGGTIGITENNSELSSFVVYPNPAHSQVKVLLQMKKDVNIKIVVSDMCGREMKSETLFANKGMNETELDVSNFSKGIYFLTIQNGKNRVISKIAIQ